MKGNGFQKCCCKLTVLGMRVHGGGAHLDFHGNTARPDDRRVQALIARGLQAYERMGREERLQVYRLEGRVKHGDGHGVQALGARGQRTIALPQDNLRCAMSPSSLATWRKERIYCHSQANAHELTFGCAM